MEVVKQTKYLKSWIYWVVKTGGFTTVNIAIKVLNIKEGLLNREFSNKTVAEDKEWEYK